jgi:DNA-binding transcriptional MocR family regulator
MTVGAKLRARHPDALDCSTGRPDVALLPLSVLRRAWTTAVDQVAAADLQYAATDIVDVLAAPLLRLLAQSDIAADSDHLLVGASAQQWMMLALETAGRLGGTDHPVVAVEEPGYPSIMDAYERAGARLLPVAVDECGAVPESLDAALRSGAMMALLTPRAHNPTGASWSAERRLALGTVMAEHPHALVVEDDQFADGCATHPGSLLNVDRVSDRVVYIRSFSKLIAPDLRIALAAATPRLRALLAEAKSFADGWTSRLVQKTLALVLEDDQLPTLLADAREAYRQRRIHAADGINAVLQAHGGGAWCGPDGLNLWVRLPPDTEAIEVAERSAAAGVRIAPGDPFFLRPGHTNVIRLNAGSAPTDRAYDVGHRVGEAVLASRSRRQSLIHV